MDRIQEIRARIDELNAARQAITSAYTENNLRRSMAAEHDIKHNAVHDITALLEINAELLAACEASLEWFVIAGSCGTVLYNSPANNLHAAIDKAVHP